MNKKLKTSIILNSLIVIFVIFSLICMMTGFDFMVPTGSLAAAGINALKYFTVDSNIIVGITSLILLVYEIMLVKGKITSVPKYVKYLTQMGTVGVTLTMLVTMFYLAPLFGKNFLSLYYNSNLFFHLVVPVLAIVEFIICEVDTKLEFKSTFIGIVPMLVYAVYYVAQALTHVVDGAVPHEYDWYSFCQLGLAFIPIVIVVMIGITYLISFSIYKINRKVENNYERKSR